MSFSFAQLGKDAGRVASNMFGVPSKDEATIDTASEPALVAVLTPQQEQAAAGTVLPQSGNSSSTTPPMQETQPTATVQPRQAQPSGMVPMQMTQQVIPKALQAKQEQVLAQQLEAAEAETAARVHQNKWLAAQAENNAIGLAAQNQAALAKQAEDNRRSDEAKTQVQKAVDDYNKNKTVNPNRAYERMGVGGRILATIGQAFGAFGSAITHTPNYAQQMIERAIDADIRAQEHEIAARGQLVNMANNRYAMFRQQGLDNQAAFAATKLSYLQAAQAQIDKITAASNNDIIKAKGAELKAGLEQKAVDTLMAHGQMAITSAPAGALGGGPRTFEDQVKLEGMKVDIPQTDPKTGKETGTKTYMARSPQDAEKVREALVVRNSLKRDLADLKTIVTKESQSVNPKSIARAEGKYKSIKTKLGVMYKLGALAEADLDLVSQLGDVTSMRQRDSTTVDLIGQLDKSLDNNFMAELTGRGIIK
jgi:hypothetical protein